MRGLLFWLVWNIPLGHLAPWVLGLALGSRPASLPPEEKPKPSVAAGDDFTYLASQLVKKP
jgi:outer membrane biogenesis lipoprotein LolB